MTRFAVAEAHFGLKDYEKCLTLLEPALAQEPQAFFRAQLVELKAKSLLSLGSKAPAIECYTEILEMVPASFLARRAQTALVQLTA